MIQFRRLTLKDAEKLLRWRRDPEIARFQYTDVPDDLERQTVWLKKILEESGPTRYWMIQADETDIGLINIAGYEPEHQRTSWGFYVGEREQRFLGGFVPLYFYNYLFHERFPSLNKVTAEVMSENEAVIRMHLAHGYRMVGEFKRHVIKNSAFHDVTILELHRETWNNSKKRYGHYRAPFAP